MGDWRQQAACGADPRPQDWFSGDLAKITRAVQVCRACPVIFACDLAAEDEREQHGIWAGVIRDPAVRASLPRQEAAARAARDAAQQAAAQAAQAAAERQERRRAMHAAQRERLRADPEAYRVYLDKARARMQRRREQQVEERERRREAWATAQGQDVVTGA